MEDICARNLRTCYRPVAGATCAALWGNLVVPRTRIDKSRFPDVKEFRRQSIDSATIPIINDYIDCYRILPEHPVLHGRVTAIFSFAHGLPRIPAVSGGNDQQLQPILDQQEDQKATRIGGFIVYCSSYALPRPQSWDAGFWTEDVRPGQRTSCNR